jgi:DNA-binding IclR family transcriptional regulator
MDSLGSAAEGRNPQRPRATGVQTLDRAVAILEVVADAGPVSLAGLAEATGLTRPTVHRIAGALEAHGLLGRDDRGRLRLGGRLVGWGALAGRSLGLAQVAGPVLEALLASTGESTQLYVREGDRRVCVASAERTSGLRDTVPLGASLPLTAGSGGAVLLAWAADAERFPDVRSERLADVRARGWAESVGEREAGVASVSAPVRDPAGVVLAAISVSGPVERLGRRPGTRLAAPVLEAAAALEGRGMGANVSPPRNRHVTELP